MLAQRFDAKRTFTVRDPIKHIENLKALPAAERDQLQLIKGHFPYGIHEHLSQPFDYITMLRDPVERMVSHYYFVLRTPHHYLYETVTSKKIGLNEYVLGGLSEELDNGQVRLISGIGRRIPYGQCSRKWLEVAKENLERRFSFVGLAERFDETILLIARKFGWKDPYYIRQNVTENRPAVKDVPMHVIDAIKKVSALDLELYSFAQSIFRKTLRRRSGPFFRFQVTRFKARNSRFSKHTAPDPTLIPR